MVDRAKFTALIFGQKLTKMAIVQEFLKKVERTL